ncbi:phosphatase PAP2 family protein [Spelaeicoccus albus]|uniref:Undecaprenyl-diphosphatase n=1 Tax=Spelaeicoccus albus TaxID=1280376 RepID=A0A7Z0D2E2_9MICO|nr:phosphatase PAP2 family protein [Spelaeicoccus albus]NYI67568.1 undecaprenyl-diphosphatase [Spelaeicoccus albus]
MNTHLLLLINGWAGNNQLLDDVMLFCAQYLIYGVFALGGICGLILLFKRQWRQVIFLLLTLVVSFGLLRLANHLYIEARPFTTHHLTQLMTHESGQSFPSDHTTAGCAIAFALLFFSWYKKWGVLALIASVLVGFARIFCGVHYPLDIAGGIVTALVGALIVAIVAGLTRGAKRSRGRGRGRRTRSRHAAAA